MSEENEVVEVKVKKVNVQLEPVLVDKTSKTLDEVLEQLQQVRTKYGVSAYDSFRLTLAHDKGSTAVILEGLRDETTTEYKEREVKEAGEKQRVEQEELKLYLKLKKKYGKKNEQV